MKAHPVVVTLLLAVLAVAAGCSSGSDDVAGPENTVQVILEGTGSGRAYSDGHDVDCPSNCGPLPWSADATVHMNQEPDVDSTFVGWTGACETTDPNGCTFVVNGHMKVTATFNKL